MFSILATSLLSIALYFLRNHILFFSSFIIFINLVFGAVSTPSFQFTCPPNASTQLNDTSTGFVFCFDSWLNTRPLVG